jgi:hypothetical protein
MLCGQIYLFLTGRNFSLKNMAFKSVWLILLLLHAARMHTGTPAVADSQAGFVSGDVVDQVYQALGEPLLNPDAFRLAMQGLAQLDAKGRVVNNRLLTIIDYSLPSSEDRFFVIDLQHQILLFRSLVSHGRNSGTLCAESFSNKAQSHQSALGFYLTGTTYKGGQGYSLLLEGVEPGFNDLARARSIVIHGAAYATHEYITRYGRLGRSFGCPALPPRLTASIIDAIKEGTVIFSYYPDDSYLRYSPVLNDGALLQ